MAGSTRLSEIAYRWVCPDVLELHETMPAEQAWRVTFHKPGKGLVAVRMDIDETDVARLTRVGMEEVQSKVPVPPLGYDWFYVTRGMKSVTQ